MQHKLEKKLNMEKIDDLCVKMRKFPWENEESYAWYLSQVYFYVLHSTRLLAAAAGKVDPKDEKMFRRFTKHIQEEDSHERLALRDLKRIGKRIEDFEELACTRSMYEIQYHKIQTHGAIALMGYILSLEILACRECPGIVDRLEKTQKKEGRSFLKVHGEEDIDHVDSAFDALGDLDREELKVVNEGIDQATYLYGEILRICTEKGVSSGDSDLAA